MNPPLVCGSCDAGINGDDVAAGLAVRIDGQLLCSTCIETLPPATLVGINRTRALHGKSVTTYRVPLARLPGTALYTFTTAGQLTVHRRAVAASGVFSAPLLPSAAPGGRPPTDRTTRTQPPQPATTPPAGRPSTDRTVRAKPVRSRVSRLGLTLIGTGAAVVVGLSLVLATRDGGPAPAPAPLASAPADAQAGPPPESAPVIIPVVTAPPGPSVAPAGAAAGADPEAAWRAAKADAACPPAILAALAEPVAAALEARLELAERAMGSGRRDEARALLAGTTPPDDDAFAVVAGRKRRLLDRLDPPVVVAVVAPPAAEPRDATRPAAPPLEPTAATAARGGPGSERWLLATSDLASGAARMLERRLPALRGGNYQLWIRAGSDKPDATVGGSLGGVDFHPARADEAEPSGWLRVRPASGVSPEFTLPAGETLLRLQPDAARWTISAVYLADGADAAPTDASALAASTSPWGGRAPSIAAKPTAAPAGSVVPWVPDFAIPERAIPEPEDGTSPLPSPWPMGAEAFFRAVKPPSSQRRYALALRLPTKRVAGGGVCLLLHAGTPGRTTLAASLIVGATSHPLPPLRLDKSWSMLAVPLPTVDPAKHPQVVLRLEDGDDKSQERGFVLGKATLVAERAPAPGDLGLRPSPLLGGDPLLDPEARTRFRALLAKAAQRRGAKSSPIEVRDVAITGLGLDDWLYWNLSKPLVPLAGPSFDKPRMLDLGPFSPTAWEDRQFKPEGPAFSADTTSVLVFCPNGREAAAFDRPEEFSAWLQKQLGTILAGDAKGKRGGFFPVTVIGALIPNAPGADPATLSALWTTTLPECIRLGLPVMDVRLDGAVLTNDHRKQVEARLIEGLRILSFQLAATQQRR